MPCWNPLLAAPGLARGLVFRDRCFCRALLTIFQLRLQFHDAQVLWVDHERALQLIGRHLDSLPHRRRVDLLAVLPAAEIRDVRRWLLGHPLLAELVEGHAALDALLAIAVAQLLR